MRNNTAIGNHPVSVAYAAVRLAQQIFGELKDQTALLVGAAKPLNWRPKHLHENGLTPDDHRQPRLAALATPGPSIFRYAIQIADIPKHLAEADIVISATASSLPVLDRAMAQDAIRLRKHKPMFMVDIAVPRDIEAPWRYG